MPPNDEIAKIPARDKFLPAPIPIREGDGLTVWNAKTPVKFSVRDFRQMILPAGSRIDRLFIFQMWRTDGLLNVPAGTGAGINQVARAQFFQCLAVKTHPLALVVRGKSAAAIRAFAPRKAKPAQIFDHRVHKLHFEARGIKVFIAQNQLTAVCPGTFLRHPKGPRMAQMQISRGRGREPPAIHGGGRREMINRDNCWIHGGNKQLSQRRNKVFFFIVIPHRQKWRWTFPAGKFNNYFMKLIKPPTRVLSASVHAILLALLAGATPAFAQAEASAPVPVLQIKAGEVKAKVSPMLYGLMTEEINYSYEGGLYGELIRNRSFKANPTNAVYWTPVGGALISLDPTTPLNNALNVSLKADVSRATKASPAGIANAGFWGIPVRPKTTYHASFYAKGSQFRGPLTVTIQSADGKTVFASAEVPNISDQWRKYEVTLTTGDVAPSKDNQLVISTTKPGTFWNHHGTIWFQQVSLFPPTFNNRPNGNRIDLMQMLGAMEPKFLRLPGGNYLEGNTIAERFEWKNTIGDISHRPGHESPWGYWSTDGFGLMEYLEWCEDLHMEPLLAVYAGYSLRHEYVKPGPDLEPYVQDALDEIEYVTGDTNTTWGAQRAKDGHPAPFPLHYVEVGNEDWFDRSGSYNGRFAQFYDAIKAKYPALEIIATAGVKSREPDLIDEHYYRSEEEMEAQSHMYDNRKRGSKTKVFVGEWATRVGSPTPNMAGALGDAAWMCCMERNSDLVVLSSYAPLFVNVSDLGRGGSMQWRSDLIGYDALTSYGSPSYYAQKMFSTHHGDEILATDSKDIPTYTWQPPARRRNGVEQPRPAARQVPAVFYDATRDSQNGIIYVKVVNRQDTAQAMKIEISGVSAIEPEATALVLKAKNREETNSLQDPRKIIPVTETVNGVSADFTREFPACSITILELKTK